MVKDPMAGCALPQDKHYARAYRVWKQNPPLEMLQGESEQPCVYCAKPTEFGSPIPMSHGVGWLHDLRPCACDEWHYCCYSCVKRLGLAPEWQLRRGPDRHVAKTRECPLAMRVAHEFMGLDVESLVFAKQGKLKADWILSDDLVNAQPDEDA